MKFVDVKNDVAFRKIFGNEKKTKIIISFLNAALKLEGDHRIKEVTIVNPFLLPRIAGEKASIIDVRAKDLKNRKFVVEMQVADVDGFDKRVQYYTCREYSMQIDSGEGYAQLKATFFIGILDFKYFYGESYLSNHLILNGETYEHELKDIQFTFFELPKFTKKLHELETLIEKWIFFIKHADELEVIPDNVDDEGLYEAYKDADLHSWKKEEYIAYDNASIAIQDARGRLTLAVRRATKKAKEEGMQEGKKEGMQEKTYKVVERCWKKNMAVEDIAEIAELTVDEVLEIIEEIKKKKKEGDCTNS